MYRPNQQHEAAERHLLQLRIVGEGRARCVVEGGLLPAAGVRERIACRD